MAYSVLAGVQHAGRDELSHGGVVPPVTAIDAVDHDLLAGLLGRRHPADQRVENSGRPCAVAVQGDPDHVVRRHGQVGVQVLQCVGVGVSLALVPVTL